MFTQFIRKILRRRSQVETLKTWSESTQMFFSPVFWIYIFTSTIKIWDKNHSDHVRKPLSQAFSDQKWADRWSFFKTLTWFIIFNLLKFLGCQNTFSNHCPSLSDTMYTECTLGGRRGFLSPITVYNLLLLYLSLV